MQQVFDFLVQNDKLATGLTAVAALFVSMLSMVVAVATLWVQRGHNRRSVLPLGHVSVGDYENDIFVRLRNDGVGPMVVKRVTVTRQGRNEFKNALINYMPSGISWSTFVEEISGRAISPEQYITLIRLEGALDDPKFTQTKRSVRAALSGLTVKVEYENIYGERMPPTVRDLSYFGRHL